MHVVLDIDIIFISCGVPQLLAGKKTVLENRLKWYGNGRRKNEC